MTAFDMAYNPYGSYHHLAVDNCNASCYEKTRNGMRDLLDSVAQPGFIFEESFMNLKKKVNFGCYLLEWRH
ncbi:Hypothetical protein CINCED_3A007081 [Cinara cedri]|uniref:Uncharacterized protein n=1 Tax=Cinara cedri TaxID=506608 RepID=A0A5E4N9E8_9HEMI|nr:Hypothetical protein CINCED_3A007081 [Cinara cedri]